MEEDNYLKPTRKEREKTEKPASNLNELKKR